MITHLLAQVLGKNMIAFLMNLFPLNRPMRSLGLRLLASLCFGLVLTTHLPSVQAQSEEAVENQEDAVIQQYSLPNPPARAPVVQPRPQPAPRRSPATTSPNRPSSSAPASRPTDSQPSPGTGETASDETSSESTATVSSTQDETALLSQYILQFNRAPVVGNALQMQGVLSEARIGFTRPRHWRVDSAKIQIRFRHSPALFAERSNLTVRLNNQHLGSVPLNRSADEIGNVLFNVPPDLLQDYNAIVMQVQQHTSADCTDPTDPTLWTEILPDSQVLINYRPQPIALDLANYPFPFLDKLGLDADQLTYLRPKTASDAWMTAAARYQAAAARSTNFRSVQTRLIENLDDIDIQDQLIVIGTPENQPLLSSLKLPFELKDGKFLDGGGNVLPNDVGIVMLATTEDSSNPVLVMAGNDEQGVLKAVQALVQPRDRQLLTGPAALISEVSEVESPGDRDWSTFIPADKRRFTLADLQTEDLQPFQDVTVNGLPIPPPIRIPVKTLPDEQILKGSTFTLRYSYGPNVDPGRSSVSVRVDNQGVGGERLRQTNGGTDSLTVDLPPGSVTPNSMLEIQFFTYPKTALSCGDIPDQPMWGTVHGDSSFNLNRGRIVQLPDLKLFQAGFPVAAPQDLAQTAFVVPENPTNDELLTMLQASSRLGRLSHAESVKLGVYTSQSLPSEVQQANNLIGIGIRDRFPLPEFFEQNTGFALGEQLSRRQDQSQVQTLTDQAGVIEAQVSPWNSERILLGLTAQTEAGLAGIQEVFYRDSLFSQLAGDTLLVQPRTDSRPELSNEAFQVTTLTQNRPVAIDRRSPLTRVMAAIQANWYLLPGGIILIALVFYGLSQVYLNRVSQSGEA